MARATQLIYLLLCFCSYALLSQGNNSSTDEHALLSFKFMLSSGQSSLLASWNMSSHYCSWPGVVCSSRHPDRVVALNLGSFNLSGHISPFLGNLSFLRKLVLCENQLIGQIPLELGHLGRLQVLNMSQNHLEGSIPKTLGGCRKLKKLDLHDNQLQGEIPYEIGTLGNLVSLNFGRNGLTGEIPRSLSGLISIKQLSLYTNRLFGEIPHFGGNFTNLQLLELHENMLSGAIPSSLGMLPSLSGLSLGFNSLSGLIPTSLWNISSLIRFSVHHNMLSGTIPRNAFNNVPHLRVLFMDNNQLYGPIPVSISNSSDMMMLQVMNNSFSGILPPALGRLRSLSFLQLSFNYFQAKEPKDWDFLTALTNCSELQVLDLSLNSFGGVLPDSLSNLSASLEHLFLLDNEISGNIPKDIGNLISLQTLALGGNFFSGVLPSSLCSLKNLVRLYLVDNDITGTIPLAIGNLSELADLELSSNYIRGTIPSTLGNLTKLSMLGLSQNYLAGPIPREIFSISTLSLGLYLSNNNLEGSLPQEIGNLKNLISFDAESNSLSGEIPTTIGDCELLLNLFLQNNTLNGSIPLALSQMSGLEIIDLSSNNLSGQLPKSLGNLTMLHYLNLSFNNLSGEVPDFGLFTNFTAISIQGNDKLCGGVPGLHLPACPVQLSKKKHKFLVIPIVISLVTTLVVLVLLCMLLIWRKKIKTNILSTHSMQGHPLISYSQLLRATNSFSETNLLGSGSFGSVYKGELNAQEGGSTNLVAVKVLKLQTPKALKSFTAECEALRNMRHRNLVKIHTICSSIDTMGNDFRAIVYDFMPNGSLESWLHPDINCLAEQRYLNLLERVTILLDVAYALDHLHCHGPEPVVHCDIKSSNVLLDADMVAHVGDFGLAKVLVQGSSLLQQSASSMGFRGTIGYAAPEYGAGNMVSTHGDIYSYGILVLETITGNRPTDSRYRQGLDLREHVDLSLHDRTMDAVDTRLLVDLENELHTIGDSSYNRKIDCIVSLLSLGVSCTQELPSQRMPTESIIKELLAIKDSLLREQRT
ncbi:hypothetical protein SEVIR_6G065850v4 [Setaria viridis]|uniref:Receptor kinase-like protein Xa21 n=1 Tax=Setaria viridis TaxID=4556 RepID=A0A4U6U0U6_SETVI|nr:receptor kinase-like protein Xa21 isoform X1 [Setaria viridis]TKW09048.1 hypothetical protein SEVIR_6G065850v2 [Setaria viridis]